MLLGYIYSFAKLAAAIVLGLEVYIRFPFIGNVMPIALANSTKGQVHVLFHGFGGQDANTDRIVNNLNVDSCKDEIALSYDWIKYRGNILRAAANGMSVGRKLGRQLAEETEISSLHCIGISVGSFAADACVSEFNKRRKKPTRLTLLCPFQQRGLFGVNYGKNNFGKRADLCEQYYISDDPVPGCSKPLVHAHAIDITNVPERKQFLPLPGDSIHAFPADYYGRVIVPSLRKSGLASLK